MSRLQDLISWFCPDGVPFQPLSELLDYEQPGKYLVASTQYNDSFPTPVLTAGQTFILGYTDEVNGIYPASANKPVVIFDDFTTAFKWVDFPFKAKSSAMKMLRPKNGAAIDFRFAYYAMRCIRYAPQDHARQWISTYSAFRIPVPPLEVQREIVRILDGFTQLEAELEAELEVRRLQYAFYRDFLIVGLSQEFQWLPMGHVGEFIRGRRFVKDDFTKTGIQCIHYGEIYTSYGTATASTITHLPESMVSQLRLAKPKDVILAAVGETVEDVGKAVAWLGETDVAIHDDCFLYRHPLNPKFVSYYLQTQAFQSQKGKYVSRAKVKRLSREGLSKITLPVPPMEEQERIVEILDGFDILLNDLSIGLPAELAARRKQHEYYRDRLLTFKEAAA
ncbi:restriction endonuclease subunit S [Arthrobacter zhangbolii]|uniref:Restriction endonuclease subunit S n=1 Tax=Arthrobacter zhangbolii TaxID=2886936 RepID=A0A9X1M816_9MICC|nr:restriction endonuclease subunit S [Arthrobacter zhangbolii]MCC3273263.1 restriction endonuclease subunit S [Arthrobacter zhangbolii]UON92754.1 restriction endonuclease subunit S [Arthrobacter zhangbolii]